MNTSVNGVCKELLKNPKPLLFIDTCTMLDVIRVLHRDNIHDTNTETALKLIGYSQQGKLELVTAENVPLEFFKHIDGTVLEAEREIRKVNKSIRSLSNFHLFALNKTMSISDLNLFEWQVRAREIAETLLAECTIVKRENDYILRARGRVEGDMAPAKKGKAEQSDCEIIECFLDLTRKLRGGGLDKKITFITANTNDFGGIGSLLYPLDKQFQEYDADYATDLSYALKLNGY